ncbi:MAG: hypothetical protein CVV23_03355 [Ignavibacteriae bacterium HGW-Ignavibacteriae-2]|jgi:hypothetical protein|nr:hypothetical protein [Bacteroidota bacterium]PKL89743.1 MAG: hypothetical protein CVV23_03355 [Ignavibacteriae bacterium HGW-Ignavibacteriae-2]
MESYEPSGINFERIIYSISEEDVQTVACEQLGRKLNAEELDAIENRIGEHIGWYSTILNTINELNLKPKEE